MKSKRFTQLVCIFLMLALFTSAVTIAVSCGASSLYSEGEGELKVVCSSFPAFEFARIVGGDKVTVTILQDSGADIHNYSPTSNAIMSIKNADVFVYIGGESDEAWVDSTLNSANNPDLISLPLMEHCELIEEAEIDNSEEEEHNHEHDNTCEHEYDEHVWLSLKNAFKMVEAIADVFSEVDPENAEFYRANADEYTTKINTLDAEYEAMVANAERKVVLFADRFPFIYLMNDYGIEYYAAFSGCSTEVNASFETTSFLIGKTNELELPYILIIDADSSNTPAVASTVASSTGAKILTLTSFQSVTRTQIIEGISYLDIMRENLNTLTLALNR